MRNDKIKKEEQKQRTSNYTIRRLPNGIFAICEGDKVFKDFVAKEYSRDRRELMRREVHNLKKLSDLPNVPKIQQVTRDVVVLHRIFCKDLFDIVVEGEKEFSEGEIKHIIKRLLETVQIIHSRGIIHRDIKPENVMYDTETKEVYLVDFDQQTTPAYSPPEVILQNGLYIKSIDVWGIGIVCYILTTGHAPWLKKKKVISTPYYPIRRNVSDELKDFIAKLLNKDAVKRITIDEALKHPWFDKQHENLDTKNLFKPYNKNTENAETREIKT